MKLFLVPLLLAFGLEVGLPPDQYIRPPRVEYEIRVVNQEALRGLVPYATDEQVVYGFTDGEQSPVRIYIWDGLEGEGRRRVLLHELGHVNGWYHPPETVY